MIYKNNKTTLLLHLFFKWNAIWVKIVHFIDKWLHRFRNFVTQLDIAKLISKYFQ